MRVKILISFYEILHFFTILFVQNLLSRWFKECFSVFCVSYVKIQENWFILVHFSKSLFLFFFVAYRAASILALASSTSELLRELRKICVVVSEWCPQCLADDRDRDIVVPVSLKAVEGCLVMQWDTVLPILQQQDDEEVHELE